MRKKNFIATKMTRLAESTRHSHIDNINLSPNRKRRRFSFQLKSILKEYKNYSTLIYSPQCLIKITLLLCRGIDDWEEKFLNNINWVEITLFWRLGEGKIHEIWYFYVKMSYILLANHIIFTIRTREVFVLYLIT